MADDSELDYLVTFIDEVTTAVTVNSYETVRTIKLVAGEKKILIEPGELLSTDGAFYSKVYKLKVSLENEANMMLVLNEIIDGCIKFNKRLAGLTYPAVMCNVNFFYTNKAWVSGKGRWNYDVFLKVEWCTS